MWLCVLSPSPPQTEISCGPVLSLTLDPRGWAQCWHRPGAQQASVEHISALAWNNSSCFLIGFSSVSPPASTQAKLLGASVPSPFPLWWETNTTRGCDEKRTQHVNTEEQDVNQMLKRLWERELLKWGQLLSWGRFLDGHFSNLCIWVRKVSSSHTCRWKVFQKISTQ